jgi:hypothetical protein
MRLTLIFIRRHEAQARVVLVQFPCPFCFRNFGRRFDVGAGSLTGGLSDWVKDWGTAIRLSMSFCEADVRG